MKYLFGAALLGGIAFVGYLLVRQAPTIVTPAPSHVLPDAKTERPATIASAKVSPHQRADESADKRLSLGAPIGSADVAEVSKNTMPPVDQLFQRSVDQAALKDFYRQFRHTGVVSADGEKMTKLTDLGRLQMLLAVRDSTLDQFRAIAAGGDLSQVTSAALSSTQQAMARLVLEEKAASAAYQRLRQLP